MKPKSKDIAFHYTNPEMVKDLIRIVPFYRGQSVLDAGSGKNKVWFDNFPTFLDRYECEIEDGDNFYSRTSQFDWIVGNPPYHESWKFTEKAVSLATKGVAWLLNNQALNSHFTPARLDWLKENGFEYTKIHIVADKRWFGRYYFVVLEKKKGAITWNRKTY